MPERWETELGNLATLEPPPRVRARIDEGPRGEGVPPMPGRGQRIAAAVVGLAVFAGAAVFAFAAFRGGEPPASVDPDAALIALVADVHPEASLAFGGGSAAVLFESYCWDQPNGAQFCGDVSPDQRFPDDGFLPVPQGTTFALVNDDGADPVALSLAEGEDPSASGLPTTLSELGRIDPGRYVLTVAATWDQSAQPIVFHLALEIVPPADNVVLATLDAPEDGSMPSLELVHQNETQSIHPQGGQWPGGPDMWTAELQSFPGDLPLGAEVVFAGDVQDVSSKIRYGQTEDSPAESLEGVLPTVPGDYVIEVTGTWPQGTAEFTFLVRVRDADALYVTWSDSGQDLPYVHATFQDQDVTLITKAGGSSGVAISEGDAPSVTVSTGTDIWVSGEALAVDASLTSNRDEVAFDAVSSPLPAAVLQDTQPGSYGLSVRIEIERSTVVSSFLLRVEGDGQPPSSEPPTSLPEDVVVPDVTGLTEREATSVLSDSGLEGFAYYTFNEEVEPGSVGSTSPDAGTTVSSGTAVEMYVAVPGVAPANGGGYVFIERFQKEHPGVLFGGERGPDGFPVAVFEPDQDPQEWLDELEAMVSYPRFSTTVCPVSSAELERIDREILRRSNAGEIDSKGHGFYVDAGSCSLVLEGEFPPETIVSLRSEFGDLITIIDGIRMSLAGGTTLEG